MSRVPSFTLGSFDAIVVRRNTSRAVHFNTGTDASNHNPGLGSFSFGGPSDGDDDYDEDGYIFPEERQWITLGSYIGHSQDEESQEESQEPQEPQQPQDLLPSRSDSPDPSISEGIRNLNLNINLEPGAGTETRTPTPTSDLNLNLDGDTEPRPHPRPRTPPPSPTPLFALVDTTETPSAECPICLEDYTDDAPAVGIIACGHVFHESCFTAWCEKASTCPMCRRRLFLGPGEKEEEEEINEVEALRVEMERIWRAMEQVDEEYVQVLQAQLRLLSSHLGQ